MIYKGIDATNRDESKKRRYICLSFFSIDNSIKEKKRKDKNREAHKLSPQNINQDDLDASITSSYMYVCSSFACFFLFFSIFQEKPQQHHYYHSSRPHQ
jgi:hypothetical protein